MEVLSVWDGRESVLEGVEEMPRRGNIGNSDGSSYGIYVNSQLNWFRATTSNFILNSLHDCQTRDIAVTRGVRNYQVKVYINGLQLINVNQSWSIGSTPDYIQSTFTYASTLGNNCSVRVYLYTDGQTNSGTYTRDQTYDVTFTLNTPSKSEFITKTSASNLLVQLPSVTNFTLANSPLLIVKQANASLQGNIWVIPYNNEYIDDQQDQIYYTQNGTNSGGAMTLFPDNQLGSWYVAMDYNGRASNSSSTVFSNQWFTNNPCNVASATLGSMNIFDMASAAARTTSTNWITLPTPQNGRLLPLGYVGSNTGTQALAFRGAAIDGFSAYNSAGSCNYFYIKGLDQYRTSGIVLLSDSSQYYIIGLNSPGVSGTWWTQSIYGGSPPNITGASYTANNVQYGLCAIQSNGDLPIDHKIYSPAYSSGYTTSNISVFNILKVRRVASPYGNIITWIGNGQEYATGINGGTSNVFWGKQQYMRQIYATNYYMCMWYGCQPQSNYFKHFFINEYNWDQNYG